MRIARGISVTNTNRPISTAIVYDADAAAFFTAASITNTTQKSAVNTLVLSLKSANIWSKMRALYPVVGGVASAHAVNLKTPGTYNLTFATGWTHASTGMTPNGATYADTFLIPSTVFANTNLHFSFYSKTTTNLGNTDIGAFWTDSPGTFPTINTAVQILVAGRSIDNNSVGYIANEDTNRIIYPQTNASGMFVLSRIANNALKLFQNNTLKQTNTVINSTAFNKLAQNKIFISALNYRDSTGISVLNYGAKQCAFASIGDGLTDTDATNFYNAVQTYQTTLSRQV